MAADICLPLSQRTRQIFWKVKTKSQRETLKPHYNNISLHRQKQRRRRNLLMDMLKMMLLKKIAGLNAFFYMTELCKLFRKKHHSCEWKKEWRNREKKTGSGLSCLHSGKLNIQRWWICRQFNFIYFMVDMIIWRMQGLECSIHSKWSSCEIWSLILEWFEVMTENKLRIYEGGIEICIILNTYF